MMRLDHVRTIHLPPVQVSHMAGRLWQELSECDWIVVLELAHIWSALCESSELFCLGEEVEVCILYLQRGVLEA